MNATLPRLFTARRIAERLCADELPKVLNVGDSISLGYTPHVIAAMKGKSVVEHHKDNAQHTGTELKLLDKWIGDTEWDVIHFNWGRSRGHED